MGAGAAGALEMEESQVTRCGDPKTAVWTLGGLGGLVEERGVSAEAETAVRTRKATKGGRRVARGGKRIWGG